MEPFQLLCPVCAAKLKVRNRSAIGQRLACPKCREMILVEAPEGHDIGESAVASASFDDMDLDALLENRPPAVKKPVKLDSDIPTPRQVAPQQQLKTQPTNPELSPGQEWVNPATKKKQKLVLTIMAIVGSLLILGSVGFFVLNMGSGNTEVADATAENDPNSDPEKETESESTVVDTTSETVDPQPKEDEDDPPEAPVVEKEDDPPMEVGDAPPIAGIPESPPAIPGTESTVTMPEGFGDTVAGSDNPPVDVEPKPEIEDEAAKLNDILAESGTSMLEIQNAASTIRDDFAIGTPKYFFERISFKDADPTKRKDQILLSVRYDQQPLQSVLHELSAISGLRLTVDVPAFVNADADINPSIGLAVENESTANVVRLVAESAGLMAVESDEGFWITVNRNDEPKQQLISVALLIEDQQDGEQLADLVRKVVYPGTWQTDPQQNPVAGTTLPQGTIKFADGKLELDHAPAAIEKAERLVEGIKAAIRDDRNGSSLLQPVPWIDRGGYAKPFEKFNAVRDSIGAFFRMIREKYDVQILADWHSLGQSGWTCDSMAPGWIDEPTVGNVVKETAHALNASVFVLDEKTVWLTSPETANQIFQLRIYPIGKMAGGRLTAKRLNSILFDALGERMNQAGAVFYLLPRQKLVVLRAPQSLHRQVKAVFDAID